MLRFIVRVVALLVLIGLCLGIYGRFFYTPTPLATVPIFDPDSDALPTAEQFEKLAKEKPVLMLEKCLTRYQREVKDGFTATLVKKERPKGIPAPPAEPPEEVITLSVRGDTTREKPVVEVLMKWQSGYRDAAFFEVHGAFYSDKPKPTGTDSKLMTWRPKAIIKTMTIAANDSMAQDSSRYCIRDAGIYRGMLRTYEEWKKRKDNGTLTTEYVGKQVIEKAGGRMCYVIKRTCPSPEVDPFELGGKADTSAGNVAKVGFTSVTIMIDAETWLQVGTLLERTGPDGKPILIGEYYFRDIKLDPKFAADAFSEAALKRK